MEPGLNVILTVDWEGLSLEIENLQRIQCFKERWGVPLVHYMNPAYFTQSSLKEKSISLVIQNLIKKDDELGLHLHGPRHFIEATGVPFRAQPSFAVGGDSYNGAYRGQEVMLHTYSKDEFAQILDFSLDLMKSSGFTDPKSFRAGGWMMDEEKIETLFEFGIQVDSSAAPAQSLDGSCWQGESLQRYLSILWGDIQETSQPYWCADSKVLEVPNNLGAIDYWRSEKIADKASQCLSLAREKNHVVVVTAHQESANKYFSYLDNFMEELAKEKSIPVNFVTHKELLH